MKRRELLTGAASAVVGASAASPVALLAAEQRSRKARGDAASATGQQVARRGTARLIWSVPGAPAKVAFTFDDGPHPDFTPRILDALARAGVHATFNVMGWAALHYPDLLRRTVSEGHEIGNHTWTHKDFASVGGVETRRQLVDGKDAIEQVTQSPLRFLRPPRGDLTGAALQVAAELGYDVLLWSVTRGTEAGAGTVAGVTSAVAESVLAGDVVSLHDGIGRGTFSPNRSFAKALWSRRDVEVRALPAILARVRERGFTVTTAADLLDSASAETPP